MRATRALGTALAVAVLLTPGLSLIAPPAWAGGAVGSGVGESEQLIREGQVVEMTDTTITIHEWAGKYTYRLSPTGRQTLEAAHIQPGDKVRFNVWAVWEIAFYFRKM